jgi:hypothetical protein
VGRRISDALLGGFMGTQAGASTAGGLAQAGLLAGGMANPWAWGLVGGSALVGGISSLLGEDDPEEELLKHELKQKKRLEGRRAGTSKVLGNMFAGAKLAGGRMP